MNRCVIVGAGEITSYEKTKKFFCNDDYIISADGGYEHLKKMGITPNLAVGDFDSSQYVPTDTKTIVLNSEKDVTDTFYACEVAIKKGYKEIVLIGMLGGRFDHSIANIQTLNFILDNGASGHIFSEKTYITALRNSEITLLPQQNKYLSIFSVGEKANGVYIKNAKYKLDNYTLKNNYPIGISNEFTKNSTHIKVSEGTVLIVVTEK